MFSKLELELFKLSGLPNKVVAKRFGVTEGAVKALYYRLYQKLGVDNKVGAILRGVELGAVTLDQIIYERTENAISETED